jgi:ribosomal protein L31E
MKDTAQTIIKRLIKQGMNIETIAGKIDYSVDALKMWKRGVSNPKRIVVEALKKLEVSNV